MDFFDNHVTARASWCAAWGLLAVLASGCAVTASPRSQASAAPENLIADAPAPGPKTYPTVPQLPDPEPELTPAPADLWDRVRAGFALEDSADPRVAAQLRWYAANQEYLERVVTRAQPYFHYIVEEITARGMPLEVALLPIVESAFDPFAYSHGRAAGLWQFIPGTGLRYQLRLDWWYDGRRDVAESTRAALDYLADLHLEFNGDWLLALAAYNVGEGRVAREVRRNLAAGKRADFWSLRLPLETSAYVPKLLALKRLVAEPEVYGIQWTPVPDEAYLARVELPGQIDLALAAQLAGIPVRELYLLNPGFNRWATAPDGPHVLFVPRDVEARFREELALLPADKLVRWGRHDVRSGDTLLAIAQRYGTSVGAIKELNDIRGSLIRPGQALLVPAGSQPMSRLAPDLQSRLADIPPELAAGGRLTYTVGEDDTLWRIAREHGVTVAQLARWNDLDPLIDAPLPGTELVVWETRPDAEGDGVVLPVVYESVATTRVINYVVRRGDTLSRIAQRWGTTTKELARLNGIRPTKPLRRGQRLKVRVDVTQVSSRS